MPATQRKTTVSTKKKAAPKKKKAAPPATTLGFSRADEIKFRTEEDLRTLRRAEEIKADSTRIKLAKKMARDEAEALRKIG